MPVWLNIVIILIVAAAVIWLLAFVLNWLSYRFLKDRIINGRSWDLNICCGKTDVGKVNVDIVKHAKIKNFVLVDDIYNLPFADNQFDQVLCSHTIEHVDDPEQFDKELRRVGNEITYVLPPLWDFSAALNLIEHKWLFLTMRKEHHTLPPHINLPFAKIIQNMIGQRKKA